MLVLTRKPGEEVYLQIPGREDIVIRVNRVRGDQVRIAIGASAEVHIIRGELRERDQRDGDRRGNGNRCTTPEEIRRR